MTDDSQDSQSQKIDQEKYWPIFKEEDDPSEHIKFWINGDYKYEQHEVLLEGSLTRLGKRNPNPQEYWFVLLNKGVLVQFPLKKKKKVKTSKGYLILSKSIFIKLVDLKSQSTSCPQSTDLIRAFRLKKYTNNQIYLWSSDYNKTFQWAKELQKFIIAQNFDALYSLGEMVGRGGFAKVFKVTPVISLPNYEAQYAAKVYTKDLLISKGEMKKFNQFIKCEISLLQSLDSPYILKLKEIIQLDDVLILISEFYEIGTLYDYRKKKGQLEEKEATEILLQLAQGLKLVHDLNFVHRDMKQENVMVKSVNPVQIIIIDFGFAELINRKELKSGQGTAGYIAPEIFKLRPFTEKSDLFSLGIIYYGLLIGKSPFKAETYEALLKLNKECKILFDQEQWSKFQWGTLMLTQSMVEVNPKLRLNDQKLIESLQSHLDFLNKCKNNNIQQQADVDFQNLLMGEDDDKDEGGINSEVIKTNLMYEMFSKKTLVSFFQNSYHSHLSKKNSLKRSISQSKSDANKSEKSFEPSNKKIDLQKRGSVSIDKQQSQKQKRSSIQTEVLNQKRKKTENMKLSQFQNEKKNYVCKQIVAKMKGDSEALSGNIESGNQEIPINPNLIKLLQESQKQFNNQKWKK